MDKFPDLLMIVKKVILNVITEEIVEPVCLVLPVSVADVDSRERDGD